MTPERVSSVPPAGARMTADRVTAQVASLLLGYPDESLLGRLPMLRGAVAGLRRPAQGQLQRFLGRVETVPLVRLQADYVATFDLKRTCCLYLTYYTYGDTRKRGMALLRFRHVYRRAGLELIPDELPDHLGVVLEFMALVDVDLGRRLLAEHRAALDLLRRALADLASPYLDVLDAVCGMLPPPSRRDARRVLDLIATGPPAEEVGLAPYGPPELTGMPR